MRGIFISIGIECSLNSRLNSPCETNPVAIGIYDIIIRVNQDYAAEREREKDFKAADSSDK